MENFSIKGSGELALSVCRTRDWIPCLPVWDLHIKMTGFFFLTLQEKYISHTSLLKRYIPISWHSPPFLHAQNDSATTAFLQGSLCSPLPLAGTQARLPWPAPRAAPHSGLDIEPLHRGFPHPCPSHHTPSVQIPPLV